MQALTDIYAEMTNLEYWMGRGLGWRKQITRPVTWEPQGRAMSWSIHEDSISAGCEEELHCILRSLINKSGSGVIQRGCQGERKAKKISHHVGLGTR